MDGEIQLLGRFGVAEHDIEGAVRSQDWYICTEYV